MVRHVLSILHHRCIRNMEDTSSNGLNVNEPAKPFILESTVGAEIITNILSRYDWVYGTLILVIIHAPTVPVISRV